MVTNVVQYCLSQNAKEKLTIEKKQYLSQAFKKL